ncbi:hypothetical protein SDRG_10609 [Saprolegnia diclina VS20]|uniref:Uncharacterized protein n=1 Tax=Saprolegnia diclina (strain VS20) TaxID=1156394 RepID=T0QAX3_SAPDV|nr:hypothetical protein SDRG_10609 [Saprolegnia diclina VS20]EQC31821.1 hypothetical protein SDRG_10609 [Saprolegnia diclina VS20]|eukprot:XP_008614828.1 hypothetical protein SDRG_10609 [Saprolegnia diclina VS20]
MLQRRPIGAETHCIKIQAAYRGWRVRRLLLHDVRDAFAQIVRELETDSLTHLLLQCDATTIAWPSTRLCYPRFTAGLVTSPPVRATTQAIESLDDVKATAPPREPMVEVLRPKALAAELLVEPPMQLIKVAPYTASAVSAMTSTIVRVHREEPAIESTPVHLVHAPQPASIAHLDREQWTQSESRWTVHALLQMDPKHIQDELLWAKDALRERIEFLRARSAASVLSSERQDIPSKTT